MTTLIVELPPELYRRLHQEADRLGKPPQTIARDWLVERLASLTSEAVDNRQRVRQALRAAGLLAELSRGLRMRIDPMVPLEAVEAALARAGGKPLSEIILEQRGPRA